MPRDAEGRWYDAYHIFDDRQRMLAELQNSHERDRLALESEEMKIELVRLRREFEEERRLLIAERKAAAQERLALMEERRKLLGSGEVKPGKGR